MVPYSNFLAWKVHEQRNLVGHGPRVAKSQTQPSMHKCDTASQRRHAMPAYPTLREAEINVLFPTYTMASILTSFKYTVP